MSGAERRSRGGRLVTTCSRFELLAVATANGRMGELTSAFGAGERVVGSPREKEAPSSTLPTLPYGHDRSGLREEAVGVDPNAATRPPWAPRYRSRRPRWMTLSMNPDVTSCSESAEELTNGLPDPFARPRPFQGERVAEVLAGGRLRRRQRLPLIDPNPNDSFQVVPSSDRQRSARSSVRRFLGQSIVGIESMRR